MCVKWHFIRAHQRVAECRVGFLLSRALAADLNKPRPPRPPLTVFPKKKKKMRQRDKKRPAPQASTP